MCSELAGLHCSVSIDILRRKEKIKGKAARLTVSQQASVIVVIGSPWYHNKRRKKLAGSRLSCPGLVGLAWEGVTES